MIVRMPADKATTLSKDEAEAILSEHVKGGMAEVRRMSPLQKKGFIDNCDRLHTPSYRILEPFLTNGGDQPA